MHACSAYEPRPHLFADLYAGYNYLASAEWRSYTSLPLFEDSRQICVLHDSYGMAILGTQASAWSRALATAWSRARVLRNHNNGV